MSHDLQIQAPPGQDEPFKIKPPPLEEAEMDITPMIDVTFLLLIFFLVSSTMGQRETVDLPKAIYGGAVPKKASIYVTVGEGPNNSVEIYLGSEKDKEDLIAGDAEQQQAKIRDYVQAGLRGSPPSEFVVIKADKGVRQREMSRVLAAVSQAGSVKIFLAALQQEEK